MPRVWLLPIAAFCLSATKLSRRAALGTATLGLAQSCAAEEEVWVPVSNDVASRPSLALESVRNAYGSRSGSFADYLSRVLLTNDKYSKRWWTAQKQRARSQEELDEAFNAFVASLELSLARRWVAADPSALVSLLADRDEFQSLAARRQLAVAFALIDTERQPTEVVKRLLTETENRALDVTIVERGSGYGPDPVPIAIDGVPVAEASTRLRGLRVEIIDGGAYDKPPDVTIEGARAVAELTNGTVTAVTVSSETTYDAPPIVKFSSGTAAARCLFDYELDVVTVNTTGYFTKPTVQVQGNARLTAQLSEPNVTMYLPRAVKNRPFFASVSGEAATRLSPRLDRNRYTVDIAAQDDPPLVFIERDAKPTNKQFVEIALCGALCASSAHAVLTPIEFAKTRRQVNSDAKLESWTDAFTGCDAVVVGHFLAGAAGFGLTAFLKTIFASPFSRFSLGTPETGLLAPAVALVVASLCASTVATFVVAPFESARVKAMTAFPTQRLSLKEAWPTAELGTIALDALLVKDLSFAVVKFSCFDACLDLLYSTYPGLANTITTSLFASLLAGSIAGIAAAVVSQPADAAFTRLETATTPAADGDRPTNVVDALTTVYRDNGIANGLYAGALERAIFAGALLALEFGIYEALKAALHISKDDFAYSLDVLATATAALPPPSVLPR